MKAFLCSLFLAAGVLLFASASDAQAQPCLWQFCNTIDCQLSFRLMLNCPAPPPNPPGTYTATAVSNLEVASEGCWDSPTCRSFNVTQCSPGTGCYYSIIINGNLYQDGDIICCLPNGPEECITCNCAYVEIDPVTRSVSLVPARSGPGWDCDDPDVL